MQLQRAFQELEIGFQRVFPTPTQSIFITKMVKIHEGRC